jgi:tRNA(fMet)-specific endonuclease VapC
MKFLLDTNVLSEPMRKAPNLGVLAMLAESAADSALSAPTWHELLRGAMRVPSGKRRVAILDYLEARVFHAFSVLPYDHVAARWHAEERSRLAAVGKTPPYVDGQIAAIASTAGLTLVTANVRDFQHFQDLAVESWWG